MAIIVNAIMLAGRKVNIQETDAEVTVTSLCHCPPAAILGFLLKAGLWLGLLVIVGGGAFGLMSPGTASLPTRAFAGLFAVVWTALGFWSAPTLFRKAFARSVFQASQSGLRVRYASFLGAWQRDYPWEQIERFTQVVTEGEFNRDLAMIVCGRHVVLDYGLPANSAAEAGAALSRRLEEFRRKCADSQVVASGGQPPRAETNGT